MAADRGAPASCAGASSTASPSIRLKTSLLVPHLHEERYSLPPGARTVAGVLNAIGAVAGMRLIGGDGELDRHFDVRLNGKRIDFHPARLETPLVQDDRLVVQLIPIGGG